MSVTSWLVWAWYALTLGCILLGWAWTIVLYIAGGKYERRWNQIPPGHADNYLWVFLVPALNEGVTIADSVARLRDVKVENKIALVINDGSDDNTGEVLESIAGPDLAVLTRVAPNARKGKAAALNNALRFLEDNVLNTPRYSGFSLDQTIVVIVDADGRLAHDAPAWVAPHFDNPRVGGVQVRVRIYNQDTWLTRMQAYEFKIFGGLFQVGRSEWGTAFMGGNGQFNRLTALKSVATADGPWSDFLTEDQELGLRLLERGWECEHEPRTDVSQQGLNSMRKLYRQRTRWMQGNLQVIGSASRLYAYHLTGLRRFDAMMTLIMPLLQIIVGTAVIVAIVAAVVFRVPLFPFGNFWALLFVLALTFGPLGMGVIVTARGKGWAGWWETIKIFPSYYAYIWVMWPVVFMGVFRHLRGAKTWSKTEREPVGA